MANKRRPLYCTYDVYTDDWFIPYVMFTSDIAVTMTTSSESVSTLLSVGLSIPSVCSQHWCSK